jgi:predicted TIM-barrel fold metal-dependent hydrolase
MNDRSTRLTLAFVSLLGAACAQTTAIRIAPAPVLAPVADHHLHLLSPAAAELRTPPLLSGIQLPADVAQLVRARELRSHDQKGVAELYTDDALFFRGGTTGWARGREAVAGYVRWTISDTPYHLKPTIYSGDASPVRVAGYFVEADGTDRPFGFFLLVLARSGTEWRIASETFIYQPPTFETPTTADQLVAQLDAAGIRKGLVLSNAYYYDAVRPEPVPQEYEKVRAENDWTAREVAKASDRLVAFCSFNPLRDYALKELDRCAASGRFKGLKLHFNAAQLDFRSASELEKVRRVMLAANRLRMPMVIHVRSKPDYGRADAEALLRELVAAAPDVPIQIAHLWGGESFSSGALAVYAERIEAGDPVTKNLFFDISGLPHYAQPEEIAEIVRRIRQIGTSRILYGSDDTPAKALEALRKTLPLTDAEFRDIADNVAPYLR